VEISSQEITRSTFLESCPKCGVALSQAQSARCEKCGVIYQKFFSQLEDRFESDFRLAGILAPIQSWQTVLKNYEDLRVHDEFVNLCAGLQLLEFAAQKYHRLNEVINDDIAQAQLKKIQALVSWPLTVGFHESVILTASPTAVTRRVLSVPALYFILVGFLFTLAIYLAIYVTVQRAV
jgi:hypothetical protein